MPLAHRRIRAALYAVALLAALSACEAQARPEPQSAARKPTPPTGRYVCLWLGGVGVADGYVSNPRSGSRSALETVENQPAADIQLLTGGRYTIMNGTGKYAFDSKSSTITWSTGPLASSRTGWVGVFEPVGPTAKYPTIRVRSRRDVAEGNMRDLQWCNLRS